MNRTSLRVLLLCAALAACSSPSRPHESPPAPAGPPVVAVGGDVLATVNGVPITRADLALATSGGASPHGGAAPPADAVLQHLVQQEALAQRAVAAHLERDADYVAALGPREAQLAAWKREQLSNLYIQSEANRRPAISEADARRYYDANATRIRTEVRVSQILMRDEARITEALTDLRAGMPFDDVAVRQFPSVPDVANKPWELAPLRWNQVPEAWLPALDAVAVGQTSAIIRGAGNRFWILKVLERRENPELTFEASRPLIETFLQEQAVAGARDRIDREARESAHIVYAQPPSAAGSAPAVAPAPPVEP